MTMTISDEEAVRRYGFNPRDRAARPWLWYVMTDGRLSLVAGAHQHFVEENYEGSGGPMVGGEAYAEHYWRPL